LRQCQSRSYKTTALQNVSLTSGLQKLSKYTTFPLYAGAISRDTDFPSTVSELGKNTLFIVLLLWYIRANREAGLGGN
jgi:hypothetical protein